MFGNENGGARIVKVMLIVMPIRQRSSIYNDGVQILNNIESHWIDQDLAAQERNT